MLELIIGLVAFLVGFGLLPAAIALLGPSYPSFLSGATGRGLWTLGMFAYGKAVLLDRGDQRYELLACEDGTTDDGETAQVIYPDGPDSDAVAVAGSERDMYRLGKRPLGFAAEKSAEMMQRFDATDTEDVSEQLAADGGQHDPTADPDPVVRQGYRSFNAFPDHDGWLIALRRKKAQLLDSAGARPLEHAEEEALRDHGGANQLGPLVTLVATLFALLSGAGMGLLAMVLTG